MILSPVSRVELDRDGFARVSVICPFAQRRSRLGGRKLTTIIENLDLHHGTKHAVLDSLVTHLLPQTGENEVVEFLGRLGLHGAVEVDLVALELAVECELRHAEDLERRRDGRRGCRHRIECKLRQVSLGDVLVPPVP